METCRVCLYSSPEVLNIHKSKFDQKYSFCTNLQIEPNDGLPQGICLLCYNTLDQFYFFKQMCKHSNVTLLSIKKNTIPNQKKMYICAQCNKPHTRKSNLIVHLTTHKQFPDVKCKHCDKMFKSANYLRKHSIVHFPLNVVAESFNEAFKCYHCLKVFNTKYNFLKHLKMHPKLNKTFECNLCRKSFPTEYTWICHLNLHKQANANYECNICNKTYKCKTSFTKHKHLHLPVDERKVFECKICDKSYLSKYRLLEHLPTHKLIGDFKCDVCNKIFKRKSVLNIHKLCHLPAEERKVFKCDHCSLISKYKSSLIKHLQTHLPLNQRKTFKCNNCSKSYVYKNSLNEHMFKVHSVDFGVKKFICDHCSMLFFKKYRLIVHLQTHK